MQLHNIAISCPAKINLGLEVLERDSASGYHRISTIMQAIDLYDRLEVEILDPAGLPAGAASGSEPPLLELSGPFASEVPADGNTMLLAWALMNGSQCFPPLRIRLEKNIPAGSGLGGGSSDGAGMLLAMRELARLLATDAEKIGPASVDWSLAPDNRHSQARRLELLAEAAGQSDSQLQSLARRIGSDVPFFLGAPCALAEGFGELLTPLDRKLDYFLALCVPRFSSSTATAYSALQRDGRPRRLQDIPWLVDFICSPGGARSAAQNADFQLHLNNDFEGALAIGSALYEELMIFFLEQDAIAFSVSGSGSAAYALFQYDDDARYALEQLNDHEPCKVESLDFRYVGVHRPLRG